MPGVGDQGDRIGQEAVKGLDRDECDVEQRSDQEGTPEVCGRVMGMAVIGVRGSVGGQCSGMRAPPGWRP